MNSMVIFQFVIVSRGYTNPIILQSRSRSLRQSSSWAEQHPRPKKGHGANGDGVKRSGEKAENVGFIEQNWVLAYSSKMQNIENTQFGVL